MQNSSSDENTDSRVYARWWEKFLLRFHDPDRTPSWQPQWWAKICPFPVFSTYRQSAQQFCFVLFFFLTWGIAYALVGEDASFHGELFGMGMLIVVSYLVGWIWLRITTLPELIGMLFTGILLTNLNLVQLTDKYSKYDQGVRKVALVVILTRIGMGMDANILKRHFTAVLQIGLLPWSIECFCITILTHFLLLLPWIWAFLLGAMIASVSPAVVVICLFKLRDDGYGVSKGIPTMLLAAAALDDSISVAVCSIILDVMFSTGSLTFNIIKGPLSIIAGVVLGVLWGALTSKVPEKGDDYVIPLRFTLHFLGGVFSFFVSNEFGWSGAGPLAIVSSSFSASTLWTHQGWILNNNPVSEIYRLLWIFFQPVLFSLTGAQVQVSSYCMNINMNHQDPLKASKERDANMCRLSYTLYIPRRNPRLLRQNKHRITSLLKIMVELFWYVLDISFTPDENTKIGLTEWAYTKRKTCKGILRFKISSLEPLVVELGLICLISCLVIRVIATFLISFGCGLNKKEKLFVGFTWLAKATVQAALGPAALDLVRSGKSAGDSRELEEYYAKTIFTVSVLSVMISAPTGAFLIAVTGPRLLSREDEEDSKSLDDRRASGEDGSVTSAPLQIVS